MSREIDRADGPDREAAHANGPPPQSERESPGSVDREPLPARADEESDESFHPFAIGLGILMVALLVLGSWFIFKNARCNPLYSDSGLSRSQSCR